MESPGENVDDIFEDNENGENEGEANGMGNEPNETLSGTKIQPPKRVVRNPRLKFNPERLCGERGIPILVDQFKNVKFKGKGYEKEDLDKLLSKLEHWTHRLFPSMKFDECLSQIEKLGKKRPVQTCLSKIRLDMPILNSDFVKDDEEDDVQRNGDSEPVEIDPFDRLIGGSQNLNPVTTVDSVVNSDSLSMFSYPAQKEPPPESRGHVLGSSSSSLSEEQKERLERNRMLAIERRKARLAAAQQNDTNSSLVSNERPSQEYPVAQSFDSLLKNETNKSDDLFVNNSHSNNNKNGESISTDLNNPNSDNLGLEDLIDLVDEEETADKNLATSSSEQLTVVCDKPRIGATYELSPDNILPNAAQSMGCNALDDPDCDMTLPLKTCESTDGGNLELESLMDLVNEHSEECQEYSVPCDTSVHNTHRENLITGKEFNAMDYENS